jgi:Papain family cysteine protease
MKLFILTTFLSFAFQLFADNTINDEIDFKLDKKYSNLVHPNNSTFKYLPENSDVGKMIALQTPIKSQGKRGTCSIFSTTAHLEALYMILFKPRTYPDFSEQWLQYINIAEKNNDEEGSSDPRNVFLSMKYGIIKENEWRYDPNDWTDYPKNSQEYRYCKNIAKDKTHLKRCLIAHQDPKLIFADSNILRRDYPNFSRLTDSAEDIKQEFLLKHFVKNLISLNSVGQIKDALANGTPLTMGIDFYYGSWNHKKSDEFGIGRNLKAFDAGLVTYPEIGSVDRKVSKEKGAGHAVLVVGYDDNIVLTSNIKMTNGEYRQFKYRGAYIIKNSWGTESLGKNFIYNGRNYPGYAYLSYKYAHEFGAFYELPYLR